MREGSTFRLYVPGKPQAWKRAGRAGGHSYTPAVVRDFQSRISARARVAWGPAYPWPGLVEVSIWLAFPLLKGGGEADAARFGDADNFAKGILDALQGIVYANDKQVWPLHVHRAVGAEIGSTWIEARRNGDLLAPRPGWGA